MSVRRMAFGMTIAALGLVTAVVVGMTVGESAASGVAGSASVGPTGAPPIGGPRTPATAGAAASTVFTQIPPEMHFVAVAPCRVADTRKGGGALTSGTARSFYVSGSFGFAPQGGTSGGCGIPLGAPAVAVNVTTTGSSAAGYLTGYAAGTSPAATNFTSYRAGQNVTANPILSLADPSSQTAQLTVKAGGGSTQVIIDVTGYYVDQIEALITTSGGSAGVYSGTPRVLSVTHESAGVAVVTLDRDVNDCAISTSSYFAQGVYADAVGFSNDQVTVYTWSIDSSTHLPVLGNDYVYLTISC